MRFNKVVKAIAIALPILALGACSSSSDESDVSSSQVETNGQASQNADSVQVAAAERAAQIKEQQQKELEALRAEHIVYFAFDMSSIDGEYAQLLDAHAKFLSNNAGVNVLIEGHADERGTPEYNIALGERRAKAVKTYLENMGVSSSQLSVVSYGEEKPMVKDHSEAAFSKNRRAVLVY